MGEYRRFVSYLYEYRNEKKEKIAGAVRVDCRGVRTQIRVDVRESQSPGQAVLLGYGVPEQPLGMVLRNAGAGGESYMWRQESGQPEFAVYSGLEIRYEDSAFCLRTFWDDRIAEAEERARKEQREKEEAEQIEKEKKEQAEKAEAEQREKEEPEKREKREEEEQKKKEPEQREEEEERKKKEPEQREEEEGRKKKEPEQREEEEERKKKEPEQREEEEERKKKEPECGRGGERSPRAARGRKCGAADAGGGSPHAFLRGSPHGGATPDLGGAEPHLPFGPAVRRCGFLGSAADTPAGYRAASQRILGLGQLPLRGDGISGSRQPSAAAGPGIGAELPGSPRNVAPAGVQGGGAVRLSLAPGGKRDRVVPCAHKTVAGGEYFLL